MRLYNIIMKCYVTAALNIYYNLTNFMVQALCFPPPPTFPFLFILHTQERGLGNEARQLACR